MEPNRIAGKTPFISSKSSPNKPNTGKNTVNSLLYPCFHAQSSPLTGEIPFIHVCSCVIQRFSGSISRSSKEALPKVQKKAVSRSLNDFRDSPSLYDNTKIGYQSFFKRFICLRGKGPYTFRIENAELTINDCMPSLRRPDGNNREFGEN
jgi:hypothetical protein